MVMVLDERDQKIAEMADEIADLKKQLEIALPIVYAVLEQVHAISSQLGGVHSRWERNEISQMFKEYADRKRMITEAVRTEKTPP